MVRRYKHEAKRVDTLECSLLGVTVRCQFRGRSEPRIRTWLL